MIRKQYRAWRGENMENTVRVISKEYAEYKQNCAEATLDKKEALKCANELILTAVELLEFAGREEEPRILYCTSSILERSMRW